MCFEICINSRIQESEIYKSRIWAISGKFFMVYSMRRIE